MATPPTIVLLHALGASGRAWDAVVARLDGRFPCFAPDLPGFGDHHAADTGIDATLDWLTHAISGRAAGPYCLVGHSMGGKFATLLTARAEGGAPRLAGLAGVVLLAASPPATEPMDEDRRAEMIGWFGQGGIGDADARRFVQANIADALPPGSMAQAVADVRRASPAAWIGWLERGAREDRSAAVGRLETPALILAGAQDGDLGAANQRRLNLPHFRSATVEVVDGAAHLLPYERPDIVAGRIASLAGRGVTSPRSG